MYLFYLALLPAAFAAIFNPQPKQLYILPTNVSPAFCSVVKNNLLTGSPQNPVYDLSVTSFSGNP